MSERLPAYDQRTVQKLMDDGYSESQAVQIASTEMEGANETPGGTVQARQTYCEILRYNEDMEESSGRIEGAQESRGLLGRFFGREVTSDADADDLTNKWLMDHDR